MIKLKVVNVKYFFVYCVIVLNYLWLLYLLYKDICFIVVFFFVFYSCSENSIVYREVDLGIVFICEFCGFKNLLNFI